MQTTFETILPDPRLSSLVVSYWKVTGLAAGQVYAAAPKRHVELVFNCGAPQLAGRRGPDTLFDSCWITGFRQEPIYIAATGANVLYGVRFQDFAIPAWLSGTVKRDRRWSTDLSAAESVDSLSAKLAECPDIRRAGLLFDGFFLGRACAQPPILNTIRLAVLACEQEEDTVTSRGIIDRLGVPPQRARSLAFEVVGAPLRRFARIARFDRALQAIARSPDHGLADVAHGLGYYDEPHMGHDFAQLLGISPGTFRSVRRDHPLEVLPHHLIPIR